MTISLSKRLIIIVLIFAFRDISPTNLSLFSSKANFANSQSNSLIKKNLINIEIDNIKSFLEILRKYDLKNSPKKKTNNDGTTTFFYRRSEDEPKKNIREIKKLIENPPNMKKYQTFLRKALIALTFNDIQIQIIDSKNNDLSGQWLYKKKQILINKNSLLGGSKYFAYLLSHEMLHVTQSCKGGSFGSYPVLLGLERNMSNKSYLKKIQKPIYKNLKENEIQLEIEAYSNERNLDNTLKAFKYFCLNKK